jgi:eukaryotic-like serine/threonine-protein kinase
MSTAPGPSFVALQTALAGRFSLEREIGRGGMGIVYLARDVFLERPVAIKLLAPTIAARRDVRRRFLREARIAAQCFHPNIVPIHGVEESGDLAWFVMAYVPGETLADRLRRVGPLPADAIRRIGREVGWALSYAHERGVVHRDVKPENILLEQGTDRALIADFGIAFHDASSANALAGVMSSGEVAGTARFMAPEQARGEVVDGRADLYALGVTLHLAATGRYPYDGASALAIIAQHSVACAPSVRTYAPQLPDAQADAIDRCLAADAADRFDTAASFVAAFERTPDGAELPADARDVRRGALGMMTLVEWSISISLASCLLILGEKPSLGRVLMISLLEGFWMVAAAALALRGGETLLAVRRALRRGVATHDVANALAPGPSLAHQPMGLLRGTALLTTAFLLAVAQGQVDRWGLPSALETIASVITWLLPPILIHRSLAAARQTGGFSAWFYAFVRKPLATRLAEWLGGTRAATTARPIPASAPTEVLLDQAAHAIFARLPEPARRDLQALPAAAAALAQEATALRRRALEISSEQRRLRAAGRPDTPREQPMATEALDREQTAVHGRLGATIAALEAIRLDLLRLDSGTTLPGTLTEQLDVVRDLQRRVDAVAEVERTLADRPSATRAATRATRLAPEPTPV